MRQFRSLLVLAAVLLCVMVAQARETENHGIRILLAAKTVTVDGLITDWDLSGGVFTCPDAEMLRERTAVWTHAMYDGEYLYLLERWVDDTPLNNPGVLGKAHPFNGDCLQVRFVIGERISHWNCWQDARGTSAVDVTFGQRLEGGTIADALADGVKQAFHANADKKGYVQEIAIPWRLLMKKGPAPTAGATIRLTLQPNFTNAQGTRLSVSDLFQPNMLLEKTAAFVVAGEWADAALLAKGRVKAQPVRLADGRTFPVRLRRGVPAVEWKGLQPAIRIACVGDSITFGYGVNNADYYCYPAALGRLLGAGYQVGNFGRSGATLLKHGDLPYWNVAEYSALTDTFQPNVVVIMLGTNDGKPNNWRLKDAFAADYRALIEHFAQLPSKPTVWACAPVPVFGQGAFGIQPAVVNDEIAPLIRRIAADTGTPLIDVQAALQGKAALVPDTIHPGADGLALIANAVHARLRLAPAISPMGGSFSKATRVAITSPVPNATLHYTLDGTRPTAQSPRYTGPLTLKTSAVLRVLAVTPDDPTGLPASAVFTIGRK